MRRSNAAAALVAVLVAWPGGAMAQAAQRGFELERAGRHAEAAAGYLLMLRNDPANSGALLGLERTLPRLGRLPELLPLVARALAAQPTSDALRGLLVRTYVMLGMGDSADAFVRRWAADAPGDEQPYRELALAYADAGRLTDAHRALLTARQALGRPDALAVELAEMAERLSQWDVAAAEWARAVAGAPSYGPTAADRLRAAPVPRRAAVLSAVLGAGPAPALQRLAAELTLAWGDPERAWALFERTLVPPGPGDARELRAFAERAGAMGTREGRLVRGRALARFAELVPPALASRARSDAAHALLEAGDPVAARRVLDAITADHAAPPDVRQRAEAQLVRALLAAGELGAAGDRMARDGNGAAIPAGERAELRLDLAHAWIRRGELDAAERAVAADSGVDATAVRGWVALYRGRLDRAHALLLAAGPYAGRPGEPTQRSVALALLEQLGVDEAPAVGAGLLLLARGDSAAAAAALAGAGRGLQVGGGREEVLLLAGRVAARLGGPHDAAAEQLFAEVVRAGGTGAAPAAAEFEWARVLLRRGRADAAIAHLEHLILTYPESAVVPLARRELEGARGSIPRS